MSESAERQRISRLLIVEDDEAQLRTLTAIMRDEGYEVTGCSTASEALEHVKRKDLAVAVVDLRLPDLSGTQLLEELHALRGRVHAIIHTGYGSFASAKEAVNLGAFAYVEKGGDPSELVRHVGRAFRAHLDRYAEDLEAAVAQRTSALRAANESLHREIAERKRAEEALRASEAQYRLVSENIPVVVYMALPDRYSTNLFVSGRIEELSGYSGREFVEDPGLWTSILHPDDRDYVWEAVEEHRKKKNTLHVEYRIVCKDGTIKWVRDDGTPVLDENGRITHITGFMEDITDRKRARAALLASEARYRKLHQSMMDGFLMADMDGRIVECNKAFLEMVGYSAEELRGMRYDDLTPKRWHRLEAKIVQEQVLRRGYSDIYEKEYIRKDGMLVPVESRRYLLVDDSGDRQGMWSIVRDITDRKKVEGQVRQWQEEVAHVSRIHTAGEMASQLAHELNQPLFAIMTYAEASVRTLDTDGSKLDDVRGDLQGIILASERAGNIISRMRNFVARHEPSRSTVSLCRLITSTLEFLEPELRMSRVQVATDLPAEAASVIADPIQVQQVLVNLIRNAVEAMKGAGVRRPVLKVQGQVAENSEAVIAVCDNGPGLDSETLSRLFEPFFTTKPTGLGMGLPISRSIIEAHGGRLSATRNADHGMTFQFTLPVDKGDEDDGA